MKVKFLDLSKSNKSKIYRKNFDIFLRKGSLMFGKKTRELESRIAKYTNTKYCIAVSSGTSALYLAIKSLNLKSSDEIIVPAISWYSTFTAVIKCSAKVVVADVDENLLLDENDLRKLITKKTKAVVLVHFTGLLNNVLKIKKICKENKLILIEDAAQAFGSLIKKKKAGSIGKIGSFSANPMKLFSGIGEFGFITTSEKILYDRILNLRYSGLDLKKIDCNFPEINHKPDELNSIVLLEKLKVLKKIIKKRISNAQTYNRLLNKKIIKPIYYNNYQSIYYTYSILVDKEIRSELISFLASKKIEVKIQHEKTVLDIPGLKKYIKNKNAKLGNANDLKKRIICLPIHENLEKKQIDFVIKKINQFYELNYSE